MDFLRTKHYSWHTYGDSQWNKTLLRLYWVAFEGSFWLLSIICATENRRLDEYELQVVSWRHALSSAHSKIYQEILREVQSKTVCRDFMQLEHICLPPTVVLWILCACFWSDVSPHRCLVAEFLCPVHECFLLQDVTFLIFELGLTLMLCSCFEVNFIFEMVLIHVE